MVSRDIRELLILKTEKLCGKVKYTLTHILHLEVRLSLLLVKRIFSFAHLLCIVCPVPWLDLRTLRKKACLDILIHNSLHINNLSLSFLHCRCNDSGKEGIHCLRSASHLVAKNHLCRVLISKKICLLDTE